MKEGLWSNLLISSTYSFPTTRQFPGKKESSASHSNGCGWLRFTQYQKTKNLTSKKISDGLVK